MWLNIFSYYFRSILVKICEVIPVNQQRHQRRLQTKKLLYRRKKTIFNFLYINYIKIREINLFILEISHKNFCGIFRNTKSISRKFYTLPFGFFSLFVECLFLYYLLQFPLPYRQKSEKTEFWG